MIKRFSFAVPHILLTGLVMTMLVLGLGAKCNLFAQTAAKPQPAPFKATSFKPACAKPSYPTPAPAAPPAIDSQCGLAGAGLGPEGAQNSAKNNFCAMGTPQEITIADMTKLQQQVEQNAAINFGNENK